MWTDEQLAELGRAANRFERERAFAVVDALVEDSEAGPAPSLGQQKEAFKQLRRARWFDLMQTLAEALVERSAATHHARRQYAQALIEQGAFDEALAALQALVADPTCPHDELEEGRSLIGRVYKQLYVDRFEQLGPARAAILKLCVDAYYAVYADDRMKCTWPGINAVAMLMRGARDGLAVSVGEAPEAIAQAILTAVSTSTAHWDYATAAEACVALSRWDEAVEHLTLYVRHPGLDAFSCASTLRQLKQVWQLTEDGPGGKLLTMLQPAVLRGPAATSEAAPEQVGAGLTLSAGELRVAHANAHARAASLEKVFGRQGPRSFDWYMLGITRARAAARIERLSGGGFGTGFLVRASTLFKELQSSDELVLVTNAHVLGRTDPQALRSSDAVVRFEALDKQRTFGVREILFESSPDELDVTVVRLDAPVEGVEPYPLAPREEPSFDVARARQLYVIGHPLGGALAVSIDDNLQVGWRKPKLHYRTPTEPGSSGSPVFDDSWRLLAVHHAGSGNMQRLDGGGGTYEANEGIWIHAIIDAIAKLGGREAAGGSPAGGSPAVGTTAPKALKPAPKSVFISYSHADRRYLNELTLHLKPVLRNAPLQVWDDRQIATGSNWLTTIERQLEAASAAILLVSPAFLGSDFIMTREFPQLIRDSERRGVRIIPIAIAHSLYTRVPELAAIQFANNPGRPLSGLRKADRDAALVSIARTIDTLLGP